MAFPTSNDTFSNPQGTTLVSSDDHALQHRTEGSAIVALENKVGLSAGSPVANKVLVGSGNGTSVWSQTWNNGTLGTPTITGGAISGVSFNNLTIGTSQITGGTVASALIGTSQITGGTLTNINFQGTIVSPVFSGSVDGWILSSETFTYASASSFTVTGDLRAYYPKGTRLRWTEGATQKFGVVGSTSFSSNTTVNIIVNTDYVITNTTLANCYRSYAANPTEYPFCFNYAPTFTSGYGTVPTDGIYRFSVVGNVCSVYIREPANGVSNATDLRMTVPITSSGITNHQWLGYCEVVDAGVATYGQLLVSNSNTLYVYKNVEGTFTASGNKRVVVGNVSYEF